MGTIFNMNFRDFIKKRRKEEGFTQRQLAELAGVGLRFLRELEQGKETLRIDKVNAVLKLFGKKLGAIELYEDKKESR